MLVIIKQHKLCCRKQITHSINQIIYLMYLIIHFMCQIRFRVKKSYKTGSVRKTLRRVRATIGATEKAVLHITSLCLQLYLSACKAHAPYYTWPVWIYNIFPYYFINGKIFGKSYSTQNMCFDSIYNFYLKHLLQEEFGQILSQMYTRLHAKYLLFLSEFNET